VLVGQPQLRKLLLNPELAQLNQRITLRWHLGPLAARETATYVRHRVSVATGAADTRLFTTPALRLIHTISGGVPRLINMIAHRALLAAYVIRTPHVNRWLVMQAYREIQAVPLPGTLSSARKVAIAAAGLAVGIAVVVLAAPQLDWLAAEWSAITRRSTPTRAVASMDVAAAPAAADANAAPARAERATIAEKPASAVVAPAAAVAADTAPATQVAARVATTADHVATAAAGAATTAARVATTAARPASLSFDELAGRLSTVDPATTARAATAAVLAAWSEHPLGDNEARVPDELDSVAWRRGLQHVTLTGNRSMLR